MGSKDAIARTILSVLPPSENFYDLFGGGFAVTHCAVLHFRKKWKHFHFNEINPGQTKFIQDLIAGKYSYDNFKPPFVTKQEFDRSSDPYVRIMWSFGANLRRYLYAQGEHEEFKKSLHNAVVFNEFDDMAKKVLGIDKFCDSLTITQRRIYAYRAIPVTDNHPFKGRYSRAYRLMHLERLERAQRLAQVLPFSNSITFTNVSYDQVTIKPNSIIYCDPPYVGAIRYSKNGFDHPKFWQWVTENNNPVFVSEYNAPKHMNLIWSRSKYVSIGQSISRRGLHKAEKLFANRAGYDLWRRTKI
jgi:site-specific DNA-adenine methylase